MKSPVFQPNIATNKTPKTTHQLKSVGIFSPLLVTGQIIIFFNHFLSSHMPIKMLRCSFKKILPDRSFKCFINCLASSDGLLKKILGKSSQKPFHLLANQMRCPHCGSDTQHAKHALSCAVSCTAIFVFFFTPLLFTLSR